MLCKSLKKMGHIWSENVFLFEFTNFAKAIVKFFEKI